MKNFAELDLIAPIQRALTEEKHHTPTPIQAKTIPAALANHDVLGCAQTGTGKTAAFALPILNRLGKQNRRAKPNRPFVLVLAPTRELAIQINQSFAVYGKHLQLRQALVYGGVGQGNQVRALKQGAHILVATPGRLLDLMEQGHIELDYLEVFVLDEADRMLDMGFLPDLKRIIRELPDCRQSLFFSATVPPKISELSSQLLRKPVRVNVSPKTTTVKKITQQVYFVERGGKQALLKKILTRNDVDRAIVFTRTKRGANVLAERLEKAGITAVAIHGNKSQNARQRALDAFRRNQVQVLVATDVAARGIDIDGVTHVVNFDLPIEPECYVHRIGRTGRAGAAGIAISFCSAAERPDLRAIERLIGQKVPPASDQPKPQTDAGDSRTPARGRHSKGQQNSAVRQSPRRKGNDGSTNITKDENKTKQKRKRRRRPNSKPREMQTS